MKKPNILFILSDDQGAWAMHCAGNSDLKTPNLDRLAKCGTRFDNFFCASPVCSPARASILTGTIPSVHGVLDWLRGGNVDRDLPVVCDSQIFNSETKPISYLEHVTTYTDLLAENGYSCALSGKWHLGDSLTPQHGFSKWFTIARGGCTYYNADMVRDGKVYFEPEYITDVITEDALKNIDELSERENPFYLSVHYTSPHGPWDKDNQKQEAWDLYDDCDFTATPDLPVHPNQMKTAPSGTGETRKELLRGYYAAITSMDEDIGKLLDKLEEKNLVENTIVIFTSDNGMNMGHHGIWGKGNATFPLNMFDTSVKIPFIISYPNKIAENTVSHELLSHYDILPTLMDYLNLHGETKQELPGVSFADLLNQKETAKNRSVVIFDEYGPVRMIRDAAWKLIVRYPYGENELYHLSVDPDETENLYALPEFSQRISAMRNNLESWFFKYVDPAIDGAKEGVTGFGQLCRAGVYSNGKNPYEPIHR